MRSLTLWRLAAILLLAALPLASPALDATAPVALADNGNEGHNGDGDDNRGHGNDPDGADEDNPGKSKENKDKKKDDEGRQVETIPVADYIVAVDCRPEGDTTACAIAATAPEGAKKVNFVQVPADILCAEVVETEAKLDDPNANTHVTGYTSRGSEGSLVLVLDGEVTAAGTATYWIKTGGNVFPVEGPGLSCDALASDPEVTVDFDVTPAATATPATGTVAVAVLTCADVPADTAGFDWFGQCRPGADPARDFTLAPSDGSAPPMTGTTDETGEATFADVAPGDYRLDLVDGSWCHANSDRVTADSEVVVEAGATSTVWVFTCEPTSGG